MAGHGANSSCTVAPQTIPIACMVVGTFEAQTKFQAPQRHLPHGHQPALLLTSLHRQTFV